jgi:hypothetical protein
MYKKIIMPVFVLLSGYCYGQSFASTVIGSAGENFSSPGGSLSWTLGEIMTETYTQSTGFMTQGFQQPSIVRITGIEDQTFENINVYPNPVRDDIHIKATLKGNYSVEIYTLQGTRTLDKVWANHDAVTPTTIDVAYLSAALYLLRITHLPSGKSFYQKIQKQ